MIPGKTPVATLLETLCSEAKAASIPIVFMRSEDDWDVVVADRPNGSKVMLVNSRLVCPEDGPE